MAFLSNSRENETAYVLPAPVSTTATASAQSLGAFSLPAQAFRRVGQGMRLKAWGTVGTNSNTKTIALRFGGQTLNASATGTTNNGNWEINATITATGVGTTAAAAQSVVASGYAFGAALAPKYSSLTVDTSAAVTVDVLGTNGSASADVTLGGFLAEGLSD